MKLINENYMNVRYDALAFSPCEGGSIDSKLTNIYALKTNALKQ